MKKLITGTGAVSVMTALLALSGCSHSPSDYSSRNEGFFVDREEARARGGVGNYVPRDTRAATREFPADRRGPGKSGYYVSQDEAMARGGVSNYINRDQMDQSRTFSERSPEKSGYFVSVEEAQRRGGVGNYVSRDSEPEDRRDEGDRSRQEAASAAQEQDEQRMRDAQAKREAAERDAMAAAAADRDKADLSGLIVRVNNGLLFETGSSEVKSEAREELSALGRQLSSNPDARLRIEGYADAQGSDTFNSALSQRRAAAVRAILLENGAKSSQLSTRGFGEEKPVATNSTEDGRQQNRRVELHPAG